jgi:segregation and condensation protein A
MSETEGGSAPPVAEPVSDPAAPAAAEAQLAAAAQPEGLAPSERAGADGVIVEGLPSFRAGPTEFSVEARGKFSDKELSGYVPSPESEQLSVKLTQFEGPLDLLLHLLGNQALHVFDIPIAKIVVTYMRALDDMRELNLDVAGEFLVMAAQLAHIKSKMLLPKEERPKDDEPEGDPRADLARRLLEYQRFKDAASKLDAIPQLGRDVFSRPAQPVRFDGPIGDFPVDIYTQLNLAESDPFDLIRLFDEMLRKQQKIVVHEVLVERISVGARLTELVDLVTDGSARSFAFLCDQFGPRTRRNVIVTFLSVLEMTRLRLVRVCQAEDGSIEIHPILENLRTDEEQLKNTLGDVQEFDGAADDEGPKEASA